MKRIDRAFSAFREICVFIEAHSEVLQSEADTRLQLIDRILIEVLGWKHETIHTEPHTDDGYIDYLLTSGGRNVFVVEAKRASADLVATKSRDFACYKVGGPALGSARPGITQAMRYCFAKAVPFAAITNGISWIGFRALRTDGVPPVDGMAVTFPTLDAIGSRFAGFYDLFSSEGILSRLYNVYLDREEGSALSGGEPLHSVTPDRDIYMMPKSELARDLDHVFQEFFKNINGDGDEELLEQCFVQTIESREADRNLEKITREVVNHVQLLQTGAGAGLRREIEATVATRRGQIVLIVGNKGAGKSTFIGRFFRLVLDRHIREQCLILRIQLEDNPGDVAGLQSWLTDRLIRAAEAELYGGRDPDYDELLGIFFDHYQRWATGEFKHLHDTDPNTFKIEFGRYIFERRQKDPFRYLTSVLRRAVKQRRVVPCIIFDNADNHPVHFQDAVFQYAYALFREVLSVVVVPITDRTIWRLSKAGALQSYSARVFYLPVPSTREVLEKRALFIKRKLEAGAGGGGEYFTSRGLRLTMANMPAFAACVEEAFIKTDFVSRRVGRLSNYDLRRSLQLSQQIITAPILKVEELVTAFFSQRVIRIQEMKITRALLSGNYNKFKHDAHDFVIDLFRTERDCSNSPLLRMSILRVLLDKEMVAGDPIGAYMPLEEIEHFLEAMGASTRPVMASVGELVNRRLIEPYEPNADDLTPTTRVAITPSGRMHLEMALGDSVYIEQMAQTTPVASEAIVRELRALNNGRMGPGEWLQYRSAFASYCLDQDRRLMRLPSHPAYGTQDSLRRDFEAKWCVAKPQSASVAQVTATRR